MMKLCTFILVVGMLQFSAAAIGQKINLSERNSSLSHVIKKISKQTGYGFIFESSLLKQSKPVNIYSKNEEIEVVLARIFDQQPLNFKLEDQSVILSLKTNKEPLSTVSFVQPQVSKQNQVNGTITGRIINDQSKGLYGATVKILQTNQTTQSKANGYYKFEVTPGTYTLEFSFISHQTKRITEVQVKSNEETNLPVVLNEATQGIAELLVTGNYKKESIAALYTQQKNNANVTNGISREQMALLPDKNIGEALKRISGVSVTDNKRVVVRGIAERYNVAMMDGATLPSTDVQVRDFEFDIVPSNLIDNVIINKTSTPDISFGFGGGLVQINTLAIPERNFTSLNIGTKYIQGTTGKDFLGYGRGKYDYLGFDDGGRDHFPDGLLSFDGNNYNPAKPYDPVPEGVTAITPEMIAEQNKRIGGMERFGTRIYKAKPSQNYQFSLGRIYQLKKNQFGFVGSISYRNEQSVDQITDFARGDFARPTNKEFNVETGKEIRPNVGNQYNFNTNMGGLLNLGWQSANHKITLRNFFNRSFNNQFTNILGWGPEISNDRDAVMREFDRPKFIDILQNRINGEHQFKNFQFTWNVARNRVNNQEQDAIESWLDAVKTLNDKFYIPRPSDLNSLGTPLLTRSQYHYQETNHIAEAAVNYSFSAFGQHQQIKSGYQYLQRRGEYNWIILPIGGGANSFVPIQEWGKFLNFENPLTDLLYYPNPVNLSGYKGRNNNQAIYGMLDTRFTSWLRLVGGLRAEYYQYREDKDGFNDRVEDRRSIDLQNQRYVDPVTGRIISMLADPEKEEQTWRYLPSASLTITPFKDFNIRTAYSKSVVRPALIENSRMVRQDPALGGALRRNEGVLSTVIDHLDFRLEWYPKVDEVISIGFFYKYFDNPIEFYRQTMDTSYKVYVTTNNSEYAKVRGWEFDIRKNLGFIVPNWSFLEDLYFSGNITIQHSLVQSAQFDAKSMQQDIYGKSYSYRTKKFLVDKRPLFGQVPIVYNAGLQYSGKRLGANIAHNYMGYKTFMTSMEPSIVEYERPRHQLDAQLSYKFLKAQKLEVKLNLSNLLNSPFRFYSNSADTYKVLDKWRGLGASQIPEEEWSQIYEWKFGFSQKYEEGFLETSTDGKTKRRIGDIETFNRKIGTSFSLGLGYSF
ncbi:TonB-dependent receptor domain-containing protein [Sphingobacterium sp. HJSM2_6]|uniref:TonB-dependent receptor n=1 Tax=Sphingobacterium sp. HJSM2_6 TaxID=3366264 RepID=UPI003BC121A5